MSKLSEIRNLLSRRKMKAAGQEPREFLPEGSLDDVLQRENLSESLKDPSFRIEGHKIEHTLSWVLEDAKKIFAILVEISHEEALVNFIEHGITDKRLPILDEQPTPFLKDQSSLSKFTKLQWEYLAHKFSRGVYVQHLKPQCILPYEEEFKIGSGGSSHVYKVLVHPAHENLEPQSGGQVMRKYLACKKIEHVDPRFNVKDEVESLFRLTHRNIIPLLAAYVHHDTYNFLLPLADMDLDLFLALEARPLAFCEDRTILRAIHGLSRAMEYLHGGEIQSLQVTGVSNPAVYGIHQDIKPKNVLVRGNDFVLADFGLVRLKPVEEGSQTIWKDATYEYGAPECRNENNWTQGQIGRAADIWSLACVISELVIYIRNGAKGVQAFRYVRLTQGPHGKQNAFHSEGRLKRGVRDALTELKRGVDSIVISMLVEVLDEMFSEWPRDRPRAKIVESRLERVVVQTLVQDMSTAISKLQGTAVRNYSQARLQVEDIRFRAWAMELGLMPHQRSIQPDPPCYESLETLYDEFVSVIQMMSPDCQPEIEEHDREAHFASLQLCNSRIYNQLPENRRKGAERLFAVLLLTNNESQRLLSTGQAITPGLPIYEDTRRMAAIKSMSLLYEQNSGDVDDSLKLERSSVEKALLSDNVLARPEVYWHNTGASGDRTKVTVEWRDYGKKLEDGMTDEEIEKQVTVMFQRMQKLVAMLRNPKPSNMRVLDCLGAFHDNRESRFGIVYGLPGNDFEPVRLRYLMKGGEAQKESRPPHIGQKISLAKTLASCVQTVHLSGWVHKDISSYNVLLFSSAGRLGEDEYQEPRLIGFQYSREDEPGAFTLGPEMSNRTELYKHPSYRDGLTSFQKKYDCYSLGLVLLEIGVWECLSNIDKKRQLSSSELRDRCIKICHQQVLERMGPIYHEVTMTCLEADSRLGQEERDFAIAFKELVIDRLESCRI